MSYTCRARYNLLPVILFLLISAAAHADGIFIGQKQIPPIPAQRALISFKDGIERLVVDSSVGGDGTELAWVIPVPPNQQISKGSRRFCSRLCRP